MKLKPGEKPSSQRSTSTAKTEEEKKKEEAKKGSLRVDPVSPQKSQVSNSKERLPLVTEEKKKQKLNFHELLRVRLEKQVVMKDKFTDLPLIDATAKTYEQVTPPLCSQNDYLWDRLSDIREKFSSHFMTQMNKKLKAENASLKAHNQELEGQGNHTELKHEIENLKSGVQNQEQIRKELEEHQRKRKEAEELVIRHQLEVKKIHEERQKELEENKTSQGHLGQLRMQLKLKESMEGKLQDEIAEAQKSGKATSGELNQLKNQMKIKEMMTSKLNSEIENQQKELKDKELRIKEEQKKQQLVESAWQEKHKVAESNERLSKEKVDQLLNQVQQQERKIKEFESRQKIDNDKKGVQDQKKIDQLTQQNTELQDQIRNLSKQKSVSPDRGSKTDELGTLRSELTQLKDQKQEITHNNTKLKALIQEKNTEVDLMHQKMKIIQEQAEQNQNNSEHAFDQQQLKDQNARLLSENTKLKERAQNERLNSSSSPARQSQRSLSRGRDPQRIEEQDNQIDADMNFSQGLLQEAKRSRLNMHHESQLDASHEYCTFAANSKQDSPLKQDSRDNAYLLNEIQSLKEQLFSKLQFLKAKTVGARVNQAEMIYGVFKIDAELPVRSILEAEVQHLVRVSKLLNEVVLTTETSKSQMLQEDRVKSELLGLIKQLGQDDALDQRRQYEEVLAQVREVIETIKDENRALLAERENTDERLNKVISENTLLRANRDLSKYEGVLIENDILREQNSKLKEISGQCDFSAYENVLEQLNGENEVLRNKAKNLSNTLKDLAQEMEQMKEVNEKANKELQYIKRKSSQTPQQRGVQSESKVNGIQQQERFSREFDSPISQYQQKQQPESFSISNYNENPYNQYKRFLNTKNPVNQSINMTTPPVEQSLNASRQQNERLSKSNAKNSGYKDRNRREEENEKLNKLIQDYKMENEKCSQKIQELKHKLSNTKYKFYIDRSSMVKRNGSSDNTAARPRRQFY